MLFCGLSLLRFCVRKNYLLILTDILQLHGCKITDSLHHHESASSPFANTTMLPSHSQSNVQLTTQLSLIALAINLDHKPLLLLLLHALDIELGLESFSLSESSFYADIRIQKARSLFRDVGRLNLSDSFLGEVPQIGRAL